MYFVKARKQFDEPESSKTPEKTRRDRYQRSDSARLVLQALPLTRTQLTEDAASKPVIKPTPSVTESPHRGNVSSVVNLQDSDFKPDELPDGACYRPKKDLKNLPSSSTPSSSSQDVGDKEHMEYTRPAEYIGTFSVSGNDKEARERQMETQLEQIRSARDKRPVNLIISNSGVRVVLVENNNVFMDHSLKRIWYATCDPEYRQFSFLAREPKTSAEVQYCHAFITKTAEQAEELISIIGEAFKSTYTEAKKQPTFHELIEQQVQQQQARFREIQEEAKNALQQKLKEIATPTPFSERAQFRMEQRRKSEDVQVVVSGQERVWAKQQVEQLGVKHAMSPDRSTNQAGKHAMSPDRSSNQAGKHAMSPDRSTNQAGKRRSEIPTRQTTAQSSPMKRNSVPPQAAVSSSPVPSISIPHPLSALAIKESVESKSSNTKFKGSPVTALKNEIDRRLSLADGEDILASGIVEKEFKEEQARLTKQQPNLMANRPLPLPPDFSMSPQRSRQQQQPGGGGSKHPLQQSQPLQPQHLPPAHALLQRRSLDDYHLPRSSSSQVPLSTNARSGAANVKMRDSPSRRQPRPMSEIATSSSGSGGTSCGGGSSFYEQQRQSLLNNFAASFNLAPHAEQGSDGMYIYGPALKDQAGQQEDIYGPQQDRGRNFTRRAGARTDGKNSGSEGITSEGSRNSDSGQQPHLRQNIVQGHPSKPGQGQKQSTQGASAGGVSNQPQARGQAVVPRYQNDSPFQNEKPEKILKHPAAGLESLMCLDRSHIHDETLRNTAWYQAGLPRECALDILQQEDVGAFIVRDSSTHPGCYALSVRVPKYENASGISHYLILRTHRGIKLKGLDKEWSTLTALVTHHTVMRELLPCTLRLPKAKGQSSSSSSSSSSQKHGGEGSKSNETQSDPDGDGYNRLSDVPGMMGQMKI